MLPAGCCLQGQRLIVGTSSNGTCAYSLDGGPQRDCTVPLFRSTCKSVVCSVILQYSNGTLLNQQGLRTIGIRGAEFIQSLSVTGSTVLMPTLFPSLIWVRTGPILGALHFKSACTTSSWGPAYVAALPLSSLDWSAVSTMLCIPNRKQGP